LKEGRDNQGAAKFEKPAQQGQMELIGPQIRTQNNQQNQRIQSPGNQITKENASDTQV